MLQAVARDSGLTLLQRIVPPLTRDQTQEPLGAIAITWLFAQVDASPTHASARPPSLSLGAASGSGAPLGRVSVSPHLRVPFVRA